jgi:predicted transposase YbfD/YdcC
MINVLTIALCGMLCGYESFEAMAWYGKNNIKFFQTFLNMKHGSPSHDTIRKIFETMDKTAFFEALTSLAMILSQAAREQIPVIEKRLKLQEKTVVVDHFCIDGKTVRGSLSREDNTAVHTVNVYSTENKMCICTLTANGKGQELEVTRQVLEKLNLKGVVVSLDALSCQRDIALYIGSRGGFFMLNVKENQPSLYRDIQNEFERGKCKKIIAQTQERKRGREETRTIQVIDDINTCMELGWIGVRQIYQINRVIVNIKTGEKTEETVYGITNLTSTQTTAQELLKLAREHWGVENNLHRTLDVMFHEDGCQVRSKNAATNLATLRRMSTNLINSIPTCAQGTTRIYAKRASCATDNSFLSKVLFKNSLRLNA